ncbi:putative holin-like toxin [Brevibacillus porteri]|nr:putative holin-like toxin [Brevibacillus porteri]MED1800770.1 putative holin-like toxin [Brevibacillus porteri]MED2132630.1 putative holin-like toxin [Brevibacillus porteri]MED2747077.1 putative holin-like toxin [Brevibacillus porteri]MED2816338.1 putative holin-like toxin [Brevibacillus porteri]MED2894644.1 putative holin-like toxin [Brevibacillus porteri]
MAITHETMSLMMQFGLFLIALLGLVFKMTQKKK